MCCLSCLIFFLSIDLCDSVPEAMILSRMFSTRHDCNCILTHVEVDVVQYFGYMPQDMIGRSLFNFYHPDDLPFLKGVYETVSIITLLQSFHFSQGFHFQREKIKIMNIKKLIYMQSPHELLLDGNRYLNSALLSSSADIETRR